MPATGGETNFFLISLFSLTAGLGCTNLLMTFFIHEYNVEKYNTDRNLIYLLRQDSPMEEGIKVAYSTSDAATQIKEKYAEITDILRVNGMSGNLCKYNGTDIKQFLFISADSTLNQFFLIQLQKAAWKKSSRLRTKLL